MQYLPNHEDSNIFLPSEGNATCERMNDSIARSLRSFCNDKQSNWHDILPSIMLSYRAAPSCVDGAAL